MHSLTLRIIPVALISLLISGWLAAESAREAVSQPVWLDDSDGILDPDTETRWYNALSIGLEGQGWSEPAHPYDRLPARAEGSVTKPVWVLSSHSAGLFVRFSTDSPLITVRWSLRNEKLGLHHMPPMGVSGLDLYARDDSEWKYVASASPKQKSGNVATLISDAPERGFEYLLFLPLYNGIEKLEIGIAHDGRIGVVPERSESQKPPMVFYGTSITQGGTVSRTGMAYPAILGRVLDRETVNLGFSGNGRMEPEMADLLGELDASVYVLDCLPNMDAATIHERFTPFVRRLREIRPETPIVLVVNIEYQGSWISKNKARHLAKNVAFQEEVATLRGLGISNGVFVYDGDLLGSDGLGTTDGTHPNDLGMLRIADALETPIRKALKLSESGR